MPRLAPLLSLPVSLSVSLACGASSSTTSVDTNPAQASQGDERAPEAAPSDPTLVSFLDSLDELLFVLEQLDEHDRWSSRESNRQAYGDGEDCEGVCGLMVPDPGPEPELPDPEILAELLDAISAAVSAWNREPWTTLVTALRADAASLRGDLDSDSIASDAAMRAYAALATAVQTGSTDEALCWLATRMSAADALALQQALLVEAEEASLREQIDASEGESESDGYAEQLFDAIDSSGPIIEQATELLRSGPANASEAARRLEAVEASVTSVLQPRTIESFRAGRRAMEAACSR